VWISKGVIKRRESYRTFHTQGKSTWREKGIFQKKTHKFILQKTRDDVTKVKGQKFPWGKRTDQREDVHGRLQAIKEERELTIKPRESKYL